MSFLVRGCFEFGPEGIREGEGSGGGHGIAIGGLIPFWFIWLTARALSCAGLGYLCLDRTTCFQSWLPPPPPLARPLEVAADGKCSSIL